jgi:hypothetical protein
MIFSYKHLFTHPKNPQNSNHNFTFYSLDRQFCVNIKFYINRSEGIELIYQERSTRRYYNKITNQTNYPKYGN